MSSKPWPADALILVGRNTGEETRDPAHPVTLRMCRDCGQELTVRISSVETAERLPERDGRPVNVMCWSCVGLYGRPDVVRDLRGQSS